MAEERRSPNAGNFAEDREKASRAGRVGGQHSSGNFAHNRERAAEAGRKGGQAKHGQGSRSSSDEDNARQLRTGSPEGFSPQAQGGQTSTERSEGLIK